MSTMVTSTQRLLLFFFLLFLFLQVFAEASLDGKELIDEEGSVGALDRVRHIPRINCKFACARRCRKASRKNVCMRACGTCCLRCHCVPPGTYGNTNSCPCYARLRTHGNKLKCP